ncbi:MAG TPA: CapA family protein [Gemmatimonadales bacterium]|nr:CapA family protein [Gemmatimonadales bacterium]
MTILALLASCTALWQGPRDTLRLYAVGDINLGKYDARDRLLTGDTLYPFAVVADSLRAAHILFGNLESAIAVQRHRSESSAYVFTAPVVAAQTLARAGFDILSTANNHGWDGGQAALEETMRQLTRAGVLFVGSAMGRPMAEQPVIVRRQGWRVAFFAVTRAWNASPNDFYGHEGANFVAWGDPRWIFPAVQRMKAEARADVIVVSVHAGTEMADEPQPSLRRFYEGLIDAGADIVLGHHPHVLQPVVWYHGKPIAQSLGNFIFASGAKTNLSAILRFDIAPSGSIRVSAIPVRAGFQAQFIDSTAADSVRRRLNLPRSRKAGST